MSIWMRILSIVLPCGIIVAGVGALVVWSRHPERFALRTIEVRAELKHVQEDDIKANVLPFLSQGFFWLNVQSVQDSLKRLPWVHTVEIRRVWPDRLQIKVQEQTPQARWGDQGILSTEGIIYYPELSSIPDKLPRFDGPDDSAKEMLQHYLTLLEHLGPIGLTVKALDLSPNGSWRIMLNNGIDVILGKAGLSERLARFVLAYQGSLQAQSEKIAYIDLRYTNGFAVGWKKGGQ
jgi:cell division protein FtsQ